jgi:hypothetical protein
MRTFGATARYDDEPLDAHYSGRDQSSHITRGCCRHCRDCISTCSAVMQSSPCWVSMPCASYRWIMALPRNSENPLSSMGFGHATCLRIAALPSQTGVLAVFPLYYQRIDRGWPAVQSQPHRFTCIAQKMPSQARANRGGVTPRDATGDSDSSERFQKTLGRFFLSWRMRRHLRSSSIIDRLRWRRASNWDRARIGRGQTSIHP